MNLTRINFFMFASIALLAFVVVSTIESPKAAYSISQKYDGTKPYITIWFDHVFTSQGPAIDNMTAFGMKGGLLIIADKANTTGYLSWNYLHNKISSGWEPVSHSMDHVNINDLTPQNTLFNEIIVSKASLQYGQKIPVLGYSSPYDAITLASANMINHTYNWTVPPGCTQNTLETIADGAPWSFTIPVIHHCGMGVSASPVTSVSQAEAMIDYAVAHKTWLVLNFHQIDNINAEYHTPPSWFWQVLQHVKLQRDAGNMTVVTPCQGLGLC